MNERTGVRSMDPFADIVKPTLVLDEAAAMLNIHRMAGKARQQKIRFRPHFKTHQSAEIGEWFRQVG
jgi:D-serine deaminase-like pyridoxal phosphate-dependent protein